MKTSSKADGSFEINSCKFDGRVNKCWRAELLEQRDDLIVLRGVFDNDIDHRKFGHIRRGTISFEYYWMDRWYNIFRFHEPEGDLRCYYCNVATPAILDGQRLSYIDLDIDLFADADLNYEILDLDEFKERTIELSYTDEIVARSKESIGELIRLVEEREFPFNVV